MWPIIFASHMQSYLVIDTTLAISHVWRDGPLLRVSCFHGIFTHSRDPISLRGTDSILAQFTPPSRYLISCFSLLA